ncbi:lysozyme-like [Dreissena polymorpha]|uniref:lysozyme n=1 Tax=Dreissena polymorpha TaxID=45954 RepID=A0A9D4KBR2_DREPO|nr:lysozyme-like [Dreissena polymorpha]KAH3836885.1 hypothetical protein DPMN_110261 [Dreissena polymorpha]
MSVVTGLQLAMLRLVIFVSVACVVVNAWATGMVSQQCMECICKKENKGNCRDQGCVMDKGSLSCGFFQIKENYWIDCGRPGAGWKTCASDRQCASQCVQTYMAEWIGKAGCSRTCESYARAHNGGPQGCKRSSTIGYWNDLKKQPGCASVK